MLEVMDSKDQNIYSLAQMIEMYDYDKVNYSYVSKRLCCPCCHKKIVSININKEIAIIYAKESMHDKSCDYFGFKMSQVDIKKRIRNGEGFANEILDIKNSEYKIKRNIPKKSITRPLLADDYDIYKLFYGNVIVKKAHSKDESEYLNFAFKAPLGDIVTFSIKAKHFKEMASTIAYLNSHIDQEISIYLFGVLKKVDTYNNIELIHPALFYI